MIQHYNVIIEVNAQDPLRFSKFSHLKIIKDSTTKKDCNSYVPYTPYTVCIRIRRMHTVYGHWFTVCSHARFRRLKKQYFNNVTEEFFTSRPCLFNLEFSTLFLTTFGASITISSETQVLDHFRSFEFLFWKLQDRISVPDSRT